MMLSFMIDKGIVYSFVPTPGPFSQLNVVCNNDVKYLEREPGQFQPEEENLSLRGTAIVSLPLSPTPPTF